MRIIRIAHCLNLLKKNSALFNMEPSYVEESRYGKERFFLEDVKDDMFIHFTSPERAQEIIKSGYLMVDPPYQSFGAVGAFAVSTKYGESVPSVQTTHISKIPSDLVGVLFTTDIPPVRGTVEEVIWESDVELKDATIISHREALSLFFPREDKDDGEDGEDGGVLDQNFVIYDEEGSFFNWLSER